MAGRKIEFDFKLNGVALSAVQLDILNKTAKSLGTTLQNLSKAQIKNILGSEITSLATGQVNPFAALGGGGMRVPPIIKPPAINPASAGGMAPQSATSIAAMLHGNQSGSAAYALARLAGGGYAGGALARLLAGAGGGGGVPPVIGSLGARLGGLPAAPVLIGFAAALVAATVSLKELAEAVKRGSKLFVEAAKVGRSPGTLRGMQSAFESIGIDPEMAERLMLNTQFGRMQRIGPSGGNRSVLGTFGASANANGEMLTAMRGIVQKGELQQFINLQKTYNEVLADGAVDMALANQNAKQLFQLNVKFVELKREWNTLWEELASDLSGILIPIINQIKEDMKILSVVVRFALQPINDIARLMGILKNIPDPRQVGGIGGMQHIEPNSMQRMGFVFSGGTRMEGVQQQIAQNTATTASGIMKLVALMTTTSGGDNVQGNILRSAKAWAVNP